MLLFGGFKISKNYALDYAFLHKVREFKDGVTFADFECRLDLYKSDHNPQFNLGLFLFNFTIFEITVYNINHVPVDDNEADATDGDSWDNHDSDGC